MWYRPPIWVGLLLAMACSPADDRSPVAPSDRADPATPVGPGTASLERIRHERLAARIAVALRNPELRSTLLNELDRSPFPEQKVHLQSFLGRDGGLRIRRIAHLVGETEENLRRDVEGGGSVELYFPVVAHRHAWRGGTDLLVATAETDDDAPVAFNLLGRRLTLDSKTPPATPVLMVSRAEIDFSAGAAHFGACYFNCGDQTGGGGSTSPPPLPGGLYLTGARFFETFEGWFKGSPEFELHMLGQLGTTDALTSYQCAGEHAGGPYAFDQNDVQWSGRVMLMSQLQIDQYKAAHPNRNLQIFVVEDDDGACQIKVDSTRTAKMLQGVKNLYGNFSAGKDSTTGIIKYWKRAEGLYKVIKLVASFFTTNDDPVGTAVEDPGVAGQVLSGATWVVRGENNAVTGAVKLEMR